MKVVVEKVCIFICVMKNEIPLFREFPFSGSTNEPLSECLSGTQYLGTISEEALVTRYFRTVNWNLLEVSSQFEYSLRRRADARNVSLFISWLWKFDHRSSTRLMPNFGVSLSHPRHTAVSFETNHSNTNNGNCWRGVDNTTVEPAPAKSYAYNDTGFPAPECDKSTGKWKRDR